MLQYSAYNYYTSYNNKQYIYNLLHGSLLVVDSLDKKYKDILLNQGDINRYEDKYPELFHVLSEEGFVYDTKTSEYDIIKFRYNKDVFMIRNFRLTVLPTLECNFNCWYCFEDKLSGKLSKQHMDDIVDYVKRKVENREIDGIELDWFGGEPMLYFYEIIYPLSMDLKKIAFENGIPFHHHITTNGYLFEENMKEKLNEI